MILALRVEAHSMFRARNSQLNLFSARVQYPDLVASSSFYGLLGEFGDQLFPDENFKGFYCEDNGRPCVPPSQMFILFLLKMHDKCSDAEAIERSRCDVRWLTALDLELGEKLCGKTTLQEFRAQVHLNEAAEGQFKAVLDKARELGILKETHLKVAIDTTPILGRAAVKDTYNLIADGIKKLVRVLAKIDAIEPEAWAKDNDLCRYWESSSLKGDAKIDWSNDSERRAFLNGLVADADRLLVKVKKLVPSLTEAQGAEVKAASSLLRRLIVQDLEPVPVKKKATGKKADADPGQEADQSSSCSTEDQSNSCPDIELPEDTSQEVVPVQADDTDNSSSDAIASESISNNDFTWAGQELQIRQGVAPDRVLSTEDQEMRHGRKSSSHRFDGYKSSVVVDCDSKLILAITVLPGNAPDNQGALQLVKKAQENSEMLVSKVIADCAYGDGATRKAFELSGIELSAKVPSAPAKDPFNKGRFTLDLTNMIATCPAGQTTTDYDYSRHRHGVQERFRFDEKICQACPHNKECLRSEDKHRRRGRSILLHPQEALIQKARVHQNSPEFRDDNKDRQIVEHRQARMVQLGLRQARYMGLSKTKMQATIIALIANLTLMAKAILFCLSNSFAVFTIVCQTWLFILILDFSATQNRGLRLGS